MRIVGLIFAGLVAVVGFHWSFHSWDGVDFIAVAPTSRDERIPAAISDYNDLSRLSGESLYQASRERILKGFETTLNETGEVGIELGNFIVRTADGSRVLASEKYDFIRMTFVADGMATNGEVPRLQLISRCRTNPNNANKIATMWITKSLLAQAQEGSHDLNEVSKTPQSEGAIFYDLNGTKPLKWVLSYVELVNSNDSNDAIMVNNPVEKADNKAIQLTW